MRPAHNAGKSGARSTVPLEQGRSPKSSLRLADRMVMWYRPERIGTALLRGIAARTPTFRPRAARTGDEGRQLAVSLQRVRVPAGARAAVPACPWLARGALWIRDNTP